MAIMKRLILCCLLLVAFKGNDVLAQTFKKLSYDKVLFYEFYPSPVEPNFRRTIPTQLDTTEGLKQQYITPIEKDKLHHFLVDAKSFNGGASICWEPHLGIIFFKNNVAVDYISVCMECNKLKSMLRIPASETLIAPYMKGINVEQGMSVPFRLFLNELLTKYGFKFADRTNDNFMDKE